MKVAAPTVHVSDAVRGYMAGRPRLQIERQTWNLRRACDSNHQAASPKSVRG